MCLLCITVVLFVLLFLLVWCAYFVSLLCCFSCIFIGLMWLLCITVVLLVLLFLLVWCVYFVSFTKNTRTNNTTVIQSKHIKLLKIQGLTTQQFDVFSLYYCCVVSPCIFSGLMCLLCITVVLLVLLFLVVWCVYFVSLLCC
jgi:hypothetical protein